MKTKTLPSISKTTITIAPDGSIIISKIEETVTEQTLKKAEASITEQLLSKVE